MDSCPGRRGGICDSRLRRQCIWKGALSPGSEAELGKGTRERISGVPQSQTQKPLLILSREGGNFGAIRASAELWSNHGRLSGAAPLAGSPCSPLRSPGLASSPFCRKFSSYGVDGVAGGRAGRCRAPSRCHPRCDLQASPNRRKCFSRGGRGRVLRALPCHHQDSDEASNATERSSDAKA